MQQLLPQLNKTHLTKDNFVYFNWDHFTLTESEKFRRRFEELHNLSVNAIYSDEELSFLKERSTNKFSTSIDGLRKMLSNWDIRVVTVYRRYFEWFLSEYDQEFCRNSPVIDINRAITLKQFSESTEKNTLFRPLDSEFLNM